MKYLSGLQKFFLSLLVGILIFSSTGCSSSSDTEQSSSQLRGYPIASEVVTTRERTVVPDPKPSTAIYPYEVSKYQEYGYGNWHYEAGVDSGKLLDLMPDSYSGDSVTNTTKLLNFFTISDIHLSDKESPAQCIYYGYKGNNSSAYSAVKLYTTQVLDAAIQTINALHQRNSFDFGMSLGDDCDNNQYNELRWFIDVLDGKDINPDSGVKDDPVPGPYNDYQDEYKAAGLDQTINWYQVLGNHDHFWMGSFPANDYVKESYIGEYIISLGDPLSEILNNLDGRGIYMGAIDGQTVYGNIIGVGPVTDFESPPKVMAADSKRSSLSKIQWMNEFFNTSSNPVGHGFTQANLENGFACYTFEPKSNIPIKVIVLDDTQSNDTPPNDGLPYAFGYLDNERYEWLVNELDKGQAEGKLMIIAAHIPIGVNTNPSSSSLSIWSSISPISQETLINKLHTYSNLILWVSGHRHCNAITAFKSTDPEHPEFGFWEVETSALRDFPQQFRTFEIYINSDNTISILTTNVDPAVADGSLAKISRSYAVASQQLFDNPIGMLPSGSRNAELIKPLSPEMQLKLKKLKR